MKRFTFLRSVLVLISIWMSITVFTLNGCRASEVKVYAPIEYTGGEDYEIFIADKGIPHFSFEYPSHYRLIEYRSMPGAISTYVRFNAIPVEEFYAGNVNYIDIDIYYVDVSIPDSETAIKSHISEFKWGNRNFRLKEKNRVIVAGLEGCEVIASFRERPVPDIGEGVPRGPLFIVSRDLFFEYQDMVWQISLYVDDDSYEQAKVGFEHILRTFRIIE